MCIPQASLSREPWDARTPNLDRHLHLGRAERALLEDGHLDTLALGQRDERPVALSDDKDVAEAGGENVASSILEVHNVKGSLVALARDNHADTPSVLATGDHGEVARFELDVVNHFASVEVKLDCIIDANVRVGVPDRSAVVGDDVRHRVLAHGDILHAGKLEPGGEGGGGGACEEVSKGLSEPNAANNAANGEGEGEPVGARMRGNGSAAVGSGMRECSRDAAQCVPRNDTDPRRRGGGGGDVELWEGEGDGRGRSSLGLLLRDAVQGEAAADIVEQTEEPAEGAGRW